MLPIPDNEPPIFRRGKFSKYALDHNTYEHIKNQWIKKNGTPKCPTCGSEITSWNRGEPRKYCKNPKCKPSYWNQDKVKETVKNKYGVDNSMNGDNGDELDLLVRSISRKHRRSK